jgi:beta-lactamase regulating signal transducer with metallopeptidase domain
MQQHEAAKRGAVARAIGLASIILVLAVISGTAMVFYDYVRQHRAETWSKRVESQERVERDTTRAMKQRFVIGAGIGASVGVLYAVRCFRRREEP